MVCRISVRCKIVHNLIADQRLTPPRSACTTELASDQWVIFVSSVGVCALDNTADAQVLVSGTKASRISAICLVINLTKTCQLCKPHHDLKDRLTNSLTSNPIYGGVFPGKHLLPPHAVRVLLTVTEFKDVMAIIISHNCKSVTQLR